jgi:SAM-dependent methyltransferase
VKSAIPDTETVSLLAPEILSRAQRERNFFNQHNDRCAIRDEDLIASPTLNAIPHEVFCHFPSLQDKRVCELGCGYGVASAWFALRGARVFSCDVSERNAAIARRTARVNGVEDRMAVGVMQAESVPLPSNTFDLVFGNGVLHHFDIELSAREILRVLKPGGVAIFREPLGENRLLEWIRRSPLRSARHRHTQDERSFTYADAELLRKVFPQTQVRESELLTLVQALLRELSSNLATCRPSEEVFNKLRQCDVWILSRFTALRPLASLCVVSMSKP